VGFLAETFATSCSARAAFLVIRRSRHDLLFSKPPAVDADPDTEDIRAAEAEQALEFPRGEDTEVSEAIRIACYEIAHSLLDGKDPEIELENLGMVSQGYESVRTTYSGRRLALCVVARLLRRRL
jgi:hypothetical protein